MKPTTPTERDKAEREAAARARAIEDDLARLAAVLRSAGFRDARLLLPEP